MKWGGFRCPTLAHVQEGKKVLGSPGVGADSSTERRRDDGFTGFTGFTGASE